jgi:hypothetical protein
LARRRAARDRRLWNRNDTQQADVFDDNQRLSEDAWLRDETAIPNEERPKLVYETPVGET